MEYRKRLCDLFKLEENNKDCVVLTIKPGVTPMDLIKLGGFDGRERMLRVSKDPKTICITVFPDGDAPYHMNYGNSNTLVEEDRRKVRDLVMECVNFDFGIFTHGGPKSKYDSRVAETLGERDLNSRRRFKFQCAPGYSSLFVNNQHISSYTNNEKLETWLADHNACLFVRNTDYIGKIQIDTGTVERVYLPELEHEKHLSNDQKRFNQALDKAVDAFFRESGWSGFDAPTAVQEFVHFAKQQDLSLDVSLDAAMDKAKRKAAEKNIGREQKEREKDRSHKPPELGL